jgi:hypothetical protein
MQEPFAGRWISQIRKSVKQGETDMADQQAQGAMRAEFEKWADPQGFRMERIHPDNIDPNGQYCDDDTQAAWEAWQHKESQLAAIRKTNADVAAIILKNDQDGAIRWATGLLGDVRLDGIGVCVDLSNLQDKLAALRKSHAELVEALAYWMPKERPFTAQAFDPVCIAHANKWADHIAALKNAEALA